MDTLERKDVYGEVFTPDVLIDELLDRIPASLWKDPTTRWLDPCAGRGQFLIRALPRLMDALVPAFPSPARRKHHILTQMWTMIELNPTNVRAIRQEFGPRVRVHHADFLTWKPTDIQDTFDVILANPPYQVPKSESYHGSYAGHTLWDKFIVRALELSNTNSNTYLGLITPAAWRRPGHPLYERMVNMLTYLHIYGKNAGKEYFGVQSRFDIYVLCTNQTQKLKNDPLIIDELGVQHTNIRVRSWPFIPNYAFRDIRQLLLPASTPRQPVIYHASLYDSRKLHPTSTRKSRYPVIHTLTQEGIGLRYAATRDPRHFGVPKVILNFNEKQYPVNDYDGKYGMSQLSFGLPIQSRAQGDRIVACINSPRFKRILQATKWASYQTDYRMFEHFRLHFCDRTRTRSNSNSKRNRSQTTRKQRL
jgi:16S rRNA G966 N2-methylase RsmD